LDTLLLDRTAWDLCLDTSGNIAMASVPYALAQDAASAIRLFAGELWYDTTQGVPYFGQILGQAPPIAAMKASFVSAALTVPGVVSAVCYISEIKDRVVTGQVQVTDAAGVVTVAGFGPTVPFIAPRDFTVGDFTFGDFT
jgi:hypothetical protein